MKKIILTLLLLALAVVGIYYYISKTNVNNDDKELITVNVAQFGEFFLYMPLYLADEGGFFEEQGLKINITNTGGDDKTFAAVIGGSADFGIADPTFVAIANEKGQKGKVIASIVNGVPFWGVTNKDIPVITEGEQLEGLTVATLPSPSTAYTLQYDMFEDAELKPSIRQASFGALLSLVQSDDADIALELEPNVSQAVQNGYKVVYSMADMYGDFAITGVTVTQKLIDENPELVQKFVTALQNAEKFAHNNPDSVLNLANKIFADLDDKIVEDALNRILKSKTFPDNVLITDEAWLKAISVREEVGDITDIEKAKSVLDMSFAKKAMN